MRFAVISDVHGNLVALEAVLADIERRGADMIVNLGDSVTGPLWPRDTLELMGTVPMVMVRGNHDRWLTQGSPGGSTIQFTRDALTADQRKELASLPTTVEVIDGVIAMHGRPTNDAEYLLEEQINDRLAQVSAATLDRRLGTISAGLVLCGHSHMQHSGTASGNRLIVNPGSVGCPRYADDVMSYIADSVTPHARYAIVNNDDDEGWKVDFLTLEYEWDLVAERARANDRPEWARAFLGTRRD